MGHVQAVGKTSLGGEAAALVGGINLGDICLVVFQHEGPSCRFGWSEKI